MADSKVGRQSLSCSCAYRQAYSFCLDCLLNWKFGGWAEFEGGHGGGSIPYPHELSHWPRYFMDGGGLPLNKQPSFNPPGSSSLQAGPYAISPMPHIRDSFFDLRNWPVIKCCSPRQHDTWTCKWVMDVIVPDEPQSVER